MKTIFNLIALTLFCLPGIAGSQIVKHKTLAEAKAAATGVSEKNANKNSSNYAININGPQNLVILTTDSLKLQTTKTLPNNTNASNTIDINGQGNTVAISQNTKNNKVVISQNGNNNSVKISQSSNQP